MNSWAMNEEGFGRRSPDVWRWPPYKHATCNYARRGICMQMGKRLAARFVVNQKGNSRRKGAAGGAHSGRHDDETHRRRVPCRTTYSQEWERSPPPLFRDHFPPAVFPHSSVPVSYRRATTTLETSRHAVPRRFKRRSRVGEQPTANAIPRAGWNRGRAITSLPYVPALL